MSKQYSANNKEIEETKELSIKKKDTELIEAFEEQKSFAKIREIDIQYINLAKQIKTIHAELNLDQRVRTSYAEDQIAIACATFFTEYRSELNKTRFDEI